LFCLDLFDIDISTYQQPGPNVLVITPKPIMTNDISSKVLTRSHFIAPMFILRTGIVNYPLVVQ